jgi:hypothetical protein
MIINLVGPRCSGKSVYLLMLAYWNEQVNTSDTSVYCISDDAKELQNKAKHIIFEGDILEIPNVIPIDEYPIPYLHISGKKYMFSNIFGDFNFSFFSRIIPGEIFDYSCETVFEDTLQTIAQESSLLVIDVDSYIRDLVYAQRLDDYLSKLSQFSKYSIKQNRRIALTLSKCELTDVWNNRKDSNELVSQRFPRTKQVLDKWAASEEIEVRYFTSSAFGCYGINNSEPNSLILNRGEFGVTAVLKEPASWRPYGLISPIYWLCTGESLKGLDLY